MKTAITILMAMIAGCGVVLADGIYPPITTTDGKTYDHITAQRTDPDGIYIEYTLPGDGMGVAKVKFSRLSTHLQKLCGYSARAGREYEEGANEAALAYQTWANQGDVARQKAKADVYATEVAEAAMMAQQAPVPGSPAATSTQLIVYGGGGWNYGVPNLANARTSTTYQGLVPQTRILPAPDFSPAKIEWLSGTQGFSRGASRGPARMR